MPIVVVASMRAAQATAKHFGKVERGNYGCQPGCCDRAQADCVWTEVLRPVPMRVFA